MLFLIVLIAAYAVLWPFTRRTLASRERWRAALAAGVIVAGIAHFATPLPFVQHLPEIVPLREVIVYASGIVEIVLGIALMGPSRSRALVGVALAAYLVAVFPGNLYVAVAGVDVEGQPGGIYPWIRLPFQLLFIGLALWTTDALRSVRRRPIPRRLRAVGAR